MLRRERVTNVFQWVVLGSLIGVLCGAASALFLWLLDLVTEVRNTHEVIIYALPIVGLGIGWLYARYGHSINAGTNLVIDTLHDGGPKVPLRMAPMVMLGTLLTHLFGGSAGREGTAVQMGASLADAVTHRFTVSTAMRAQLLAAGVAGGFGSVFGTPLAGAVFGVEFMVLRRFKLDALLPALIASFVGDAVTRALGIAHTHYPSAPHAAWSLALLGKWLVFALGIALTTVAFIELTHALKKHGQRWLPQLSLRMFFGGLCVIALWKLLGSSDYLGLGVPTIVRSFEDPSLPTHAFAAKLVLTAITLGAGFLGGEVTPLFFVGAALGNTLAQLLGVPLALGAGVGMAAMFGAAANTPLALSIMAAELLGVQVFPHVLFVSVVAYLLTGRRSIYTSQLRRRDLEADARKV